MDILRATEPHFPHRQGNALILVLRGGDVARRTALAMHWATAHRASFGGGTFYVYADDFRDDHGVQVAAVMADLVQRLGTEHGHVPESTADRIELFRRLTANAPTLVVIDGADEPAQVRAVVPSAPGSVVLATTRHALKGLELDDAVYLDVPQTP